MLVKETDKSLESREGDSNEHMGNLMLHEKMVQVKGEQKDGRGLREGGKKIIFHRDDS